MNSAPSGSDASERSIHSNWMLSFGDLLTLLLCFFLSILSCSPLNPANESATNIKEVQGVTGTDAAGATAEAAQTMDGTALANLSTSDVKATLPNNVSVVNGLRLWMQTGDYAESGWELSEAAAERLKSQVVRTAYEPKRVTIESCLESAVKGDETAWAGSISRVLALRSQLIDAGFKAGNFRYRVLGPHCSAVRSGGMDDSVEAKTAVSKISIEFETNNG